MYTISRDTLGKHKVFTRIGHNPDIAAAGNEGVWGVAADRGTNGAYGAASALDITSTNASDAGKVLYIEGEVDGVYATEQIALHATAPQTTAVTTTKEFSGILQARFLGDTKAVGTVYAALTGTGHTGGTPSTLSATRFVISVGGRVDNASFIDVPADARCFIIEPSVNIDLTTGTFIYTFSQKGSLSTVAGTHKLTSPSFGKLFQMWALEPGYGLYLSGKSTTGDREVTTVFTAIVSWG